MVRIEIEEFACLTCLLVGGMGQQMKTGPQIDPLETFGKGFVGAASRKAGYLGIGLEEMESVDMHGECRLVTCIYSIMLTCMA